MLFSVIIPVYNVEKYLKECLDSVINQTLPNWEAICVNDGSTDGSATVLKEYAEKDNRIRVITQENRGLSAARNTGINAAAGDYVVFLDSDDWLELDALEKISGSLNGEDLICFSGRRYFEDKKLYNSADILSEKTYNSGMDYYNDNALQHRDFAFVCVVLRIYRRDFLLENKLKFKEGIYHEDNLFTPIVCYYAKKVRVVNECLYNYRVRINSITTTSSIKHRINMMEIANELAAFFTSHDGFNKSIVYRAITHHYQVAFKDAEIDEQKELKRLCDWSLYKKVSRTKLRHKWNYYINKITW